MPQQASTLPGAHKFISVYSTMSETRVQGNKITHVYVKSNNGHSWEPALQLLVADGKAKITRPKFETEQVRWQSTC